MQKKGGEIMEKLWTPGRIGPMETKNRTIRSATNEHLATRQGELTQAWMDANLELARGGVGVIITGQFAMDATQRADEGQPVLVEDMDPDMLERSCAILKKTCRQVGEYGVRLVVQLSHTGPKALESVNGRPPAFPADFTREELEKLVRAFAFGARTCKDCGADGVQVHMAHGYLLSSFLNPELNTRGDEYGGSLENRFRLPGEIIRAVREVCGEDFPILVKADSNCCGDLPGLLRLCKEAGADCAEISGLDFATRSRENGAFYLDAVTQARQGIELPLALVGGVYTLEGARQVVDSGIEFVSFARALICQPDLINKMYRGEAVQGDCTGCSGCFKVFRQKPWRCVFHNQPIEQLKQTFGT